jgi:hypothetical protein
VTPSTEPPHTGEACEHPSRLCDNGTLCINVNQLCDERFDCADKSDEGLRCSKLTNTRLMRENFFF